MSDGELLEERRGSVHLVTINRPDVRNALNTALVEGIGRAMTDADADPDVRCVVITGAGTGAFCAGMDLREFAAGRRGDPERTAAFTRVLREGVVTPSVCAANGSAFGGGLELLLSCDLVVAADGARFGFAEVKRGLVPAAGGMLVGQRIPFSVALEMTMTGEAIDARRAHEVGLVNRVVPPDRVLDEALALAATIAALSPLAVSVVKHVVRLAATSPAEAAALSAELVPMVFDSDDAREGATAFVERRDPVWTGRPWTPGD